MRWITGVALAAVVALAMMNLRLSRQLEAARDTSTPGRAEAIAPVPSEEPGGSALRRERDRLLAEIQRLRGDLARVREVEAGREAESEAPAAAGEVAKAETRPTGQAWRPRGARSVEARYGALFESLNLSDRDAEALRALLAERLEQRASGAAGAEPDPFAERIEDLIGASNLQMLQEYEQADGDRMLVAAFNESLGEEDGLTADQERALVEALYEERRASDGFDPFTGGEPPDPAALSDEDLATYESNVMDLIDRQVDAAARGDLTPAQIERLEASLRQDAVLRIMSLEMVREVMRNDVTPPPDAAGPEG